MDLPETPVQREGNLLSLPEDDLPPRSTSWPALPDLPRVALPDDIVRGNHPRHHLLYLTMWPRRRVCLSEEVAAHAKSLPFLPNADDLPGLRTQHPPAPGHGGWRAPAATDTAGRRVNPPAVRRLPQAEAQWGGREALQGGRRRVPGGEVAIRIIWQLVG